MAEYEGGAWFERVARAGRTLAFLTDEGRTVQLVEAARSVNSE